MKIWITKYALTSGIEEHEVSPSDIQDGERLYFKRPGDLFAQGSSHKEWHHSYEEAQARAEEMRQKKIASVKKKLARLEAMKF